HHPRIRLLGLRLTQLRHRAGDKALACFEHVRALPFGCLGDGTGVPSLTVLQRGRGDCHTKSTLLVALLRSVGIPSRLRFFSMPSTFLQGIIDLEGLPIQHCCVEMLLENGWVTVDSHVVDQPLAHAAQSRLAAEGRRVGYGMHVDGETAWDGHTPSFAQFCASDPDSLPTRDWGAFDDPYQFYSSVPAVQERLGLAARLRWTVGARLVNRRVAALRAEPANAVG
ncbi:MAG: transglutaminase domain-containing protein, partial [Burkholderiales bacterium]